MRLALPPGSLRNKDVSMTRSRILVWVVVCVLAVAGRAWAQEEDPVFGRGGFDKAHPYFSQLPFENIDAASGGLVLTFTDFVLPGNGGMDLRFIHSYNSKHSEAGDWTFGLAVSR